jgi:hypothetical protein
LTENARERVTDRGRPSGIATTTTVIARIRNFSKVARSSDVSQGFFVPLKIPNLMKSTTRMRMAE